MLNIDRDLDGHDDGHSTCKQTLKRKTVEPVVSGLNKIQKIIG